MNAKLKTTIVLLLLAIITAWLLDWLTEDDKDSQKRLQHKPDYYMENFETRTMDLEGNLKSILNADYMAHFANDDTTELINPVMELFRIDKPPMIINSEKGWVTSDGEVILLEGKARLREIGYDGELNLQVDSSNVRILMDQEYAETDEHAIITGKRTLIHADGMRAYFQQDRIELLSNVTGVIEPKKKAE